MAGKRGIKVQFAIHETQDVWQRLQQTNTPIVLYGTGNGADKILDAFAAYGIPVADIFVSDSFYRAQTFRGFQVLTFADVCRKYTDCLIILAFAVFRPDMLQRIRDIQKHYEVLAPEMPVFGTGYYTWNTLEEQGGQMDHVWQMLEDDSSRQVLENLINYRISGKLIYLEQATSPRSEVFQNILHLDGNEAYADLGAYRGDTIQEFLEQTGGSFRQIYALEPDEKNYQRLTDWVQTLPKEQQKKISCYPLASWCDRRVLPFDGGGGRNSSLQTGRRVAHTTDLDTLLGEQPVTYVKMDVEGADKETLLGMQKTLARQQPKLAVSAYHRTEDLLMLPDLIRQGNPNYRIYLRHHPYIPAWETNYYCV
ncbi:MAG: FkbM family methyltransferase [Acutalibacteraceae bacterium]